VKHDPGWMRNQLQPRLEAIVFQELTQTIRMLAPCVAVAMLAVTSPALAGDSIDTREEGATQDSAREQELLSIRNGWAILALDRVHRVPDNIARCVLLYSEKPGLISVDLDAGGSVRGYVGLGFDGDDELEVVIAVQDLLASTVPDAHVTDASGFMQDIEAETGFGFIGMADVLVDAPLVDLLVVVDPLGSMEQMMAVLEMALSTGMYGPGDSFLDPLSEPDQPFLAFEPQLAPADVGMKPATPPPPPPGSPGSARH